MVLPEPIVFVSPGGTPDTSLTVFGQEFHAESVVLRLHSGFFRTFLTAKAETSTSKFKYEYVSKVDKDGTWGLQPKHTVHDEDGSQTRPVDADSITIPAFRNLLCAFYSRRYQIHDSIRGLAALVQVADYYRALPVISVTFEASLFTTYSFKDISDNCAQALNLAYQLRSPPLFKDAFVHVIAHVNIDLKFISNVDVRLHTLIHEHLAVLKSKLSDASRALILTAARASAWTAFVPNQLILPNIHAASLNLPAGWGRAEEPTFYRYLFEASYKPTEAQIISCCRGRGHITVEASILEVTNTVKGLLAPLLKNNLCIHPLKRVGEDKVYFLCTQLSDSELPWDPEEINW